MSRERGYAQPAHQGDEFAYAEAFTLYLRRHHPAIAAILAHNDVAHHPERWKDAA